MAQASSRSRPDVHVDTTARLGTLRDFLNRRIDGELRFDVAPGGCSRPDRSVLWFSRVISLPDAASGSLGWEPDAAGSRMNSGGDITG